MLVLLPLLTLGLALLVDEPNGLSEDELEILASLEAAIADSGDPNATRTWYLLDGPEYDAVQSLVKKGFVAKVGVGQAGIGNPYLANTHFLDGPIPCFLGRLWATDLKKVRKNAYWRLN